MLTKRIIPCLDMKNGRVIKGVSFVSHRDAGDPAELASAYDEQGADELVLLDISASHENRNILLDVVKRTAEVLFIPFMVGGGIRSMSDARLVLCSGADKVSVNTAAIQRPELISELSRIFGSQCVVVAIDAKRVIDKNKKRFIVYSHSATKATKLEAGSWARKVQQKGAGELLVTSIDRDGTKLGYDIELLNYITNQVNIPVIASGGCGSLPHFLSAFTEANCDAALAASLFHYQELSIRQVKQYLNSNGVVVRP